MEIERKLTIKWDPQVLLSRGVRNISCISDHYNKRQIVESTVESGNCSLSNSFNSRYNLTVMESGSTVENITLGAYTTCLECKHLSNNNLAI